MQQLQIPYNFTPREDQLNLFRAMDGVQGKPETRKQRGFLVWHRRRGKDKGCFCYMIKEAARVPGNYFYIFPTKTMARRAVWENVDSSGFKMLNHIPREFLTGPPNNQEMLLSFKNGSTIRVIGFDKDPDSIRGVPCKGAVFSEFAFSDPEAYKVMVPALRESKGWAIVNSTPNGRNHFYDLYSRVKDSENWYVSVRQTLYPDRENYTGAFTPVELEEIQMEEGYTEEDMAREFGCDFATELKGSYYSANIQKAIEEGRVGSFDYNEDILVDTYWDIGYSDHTAIWFVQTSGNRKILIDYYENTGKGLEHYIDVLQEKGYRYGTHVWPHDGARTNWATEETPVDRFEAIIRGQQLDWRVDFVPKSKNIQNDINVVRSKFKHFYFNEVPCKEGISHLELYHKKYDKKRQVYLKDPVHDLHSHAADALRTMVMYGDISNDPFYHQNNLKVNRDYDIFD